MKTLALIAGCLLTGPAWAAATGQIVSLDGTPVAGAQVCDFVEGTPEHCVTTDASGVYRMETPRRPTLVVRAKGFVATSVDAALLPAPVTLKPAAVLRVTVVDGASDLPLGSGRVMVNAPSGQRIGDFVPFNKAGVRISTLTPGPVLVRVEADGYEPGGPVAVELVGGVERVVTVRMTKAGGTSR